MGNTLDVYFAFDGWLLGCASKTRHLTRVFRGCIRAKSGRETGPSVQSRWSASTFSFTQSRSTVGRAWGGCNGGMKKPMRITARAFG